MNASEIRTQLMKEHDQLRALIEETRALARLARPGERVPKASMDRLSRALLAHNLREQELLEGILATVDAWGPVRVEIMDEGHKAEHQALYAAVSESDGVDPERAEPLLDRVLEHIIREEQTFLNEDVLRDDTVIIDAFAG
jgi:hypothetical protein